MPNVKDICNKIGKEAVNHSSEILIGCGIAGAATSIIFAWNMAPKAQRILKEERKEAEKENREYKKLDAVKDTWRYWAPPMAMFAVSTACIIGSSTISHKRNAALAAAYTLSEKTLFDYRTRVAEKLTDEVEKEVFKESAVNASKDAPLPNKELYFVGDDEQLCYDAFTSQWFKSTVNHLEKVQNDLNRRMLVGMEMYISMNEYIDEVGSPDLKRIPYGDEVGWNINKNGHIELTFTGAIRDDGKPYIIVSHFSEPMNKYNEIY